MQTKLRRAESLQTEVVSLRNALSESEANTQEAIRLAEVAKDDLGKIHETSGQWQRRAADLDQENKRFKDMLERHASIVSPTKNYLFQLRSCNACFVRRADCKKRRIASSTNS